MTKYLIALVIFGFLSCQESKVEMDILQDEEKVVDILVDMYIAESALNKQSIAVRDSLTVVYRDNIILIHDLSQVEFDTLFWLIQTDMTNYGSIHKKVLTKIKGLDSSSAKK